MHADELRTAVAKIVEILDKSDIRVVIDQYRSARGDQRTVAAARLGHAGAVIMERFESLSRDEIRVANTLHLAALGSKDFWQNLLGGTADPKTHQGDIVRLASRVMFATGHLPNLLNLLGDVTSVSATNPHRRFPLGGGEGRLIIRLSDAGERASDPDRVARSVDGIDMLYSACASIARKPAMDLRLEGVTGEKANRDIHFTGDHDSIAAVVAVIESIPAALADIDPDKDIDLEAIVQSLPIFEDLNTLASLGTFSARDLKDISDTMHQGALLVLESGVILVYEPDEQHASPAATSIREPVTPTVVASGAAPVVAPAVNSAPLSSPVHTDSSAHNTTQDTHDTTQDTHARADQSAAKSAASLPAAAEDEPPVLTQRAANTAKSDSQGDADNVKDEHYERYLREREAMQKSTGNGVLDSGAEDQRRRDAVAELLKSLGQARDN